MDEEGSPQARAAVEAADAVATSRVAFAEAHAAFAAAARLGRITAAERAAVAALLRLDWRAYVVVGVTQPLVELVVRPTSSFTDAVPLEEEPQKDAVRAPSWEPGRLRRS